MNLVNLTPHALNIHQRNGEVLNLAPSGQVARVSVSEQVIDDLFQVAVFGQVQDLPEPSPDTVFIVSGLVRDRVPERADVASPGALLRDEKGQPIGCKGLVINK